MRLCSPPRTGCTSSRQSLDRKTWVREEVREAATVMTVESRRITVTGVGPRLGRRRGYTRNVVVLRTIVAALVIVLAPAVAWAQRVTKVPDGDTLVVHGVGEVHLLGIKSADEPALHLGPSGPPPQPRRGPSTPAPAAVSGSLNLSRDRPSRDLLRKLALGRTVRSNTTRLRDWAAGAARTCSWRTGRSSTRRC